MTDDGGQQGIRVKLRALVSSEPEQRFDAYGAELLQFRATAVDASRHHPPLVVRFGGQRQRELRRWITPGKHLSVEGDLEVKAWKDSANRWRVALLIEALNIFQLSDVADLSKVGVYTTAGRTGPALPPTPTSKAQRAQQVRALLEKRDEP